MQKTDLFTPDARVALLVDADNVDGRLIAFADARAATLGTIVVRRAFGRIDAIRAHEALLGSLGFGAEVALAAVRVPKNSADLLLGLYAMRLAERRAVESVALVSSDSDFAMVARGLAEAGVAVVGFGRADAPPALRASCARFVPFAPAPADAAVREAGDLPAEDLTKLRRVIDAALGTGRRAPASRVGQQINPAFGGDYKRHFRVSTLSQLVNRLEGYAIEGEGTVKSVVALDGR